jgi:hypothetical protein
MLEAMFSMLPPMGTSALLRSLSPYIPDDFINQLQLRSRGGGRRHAFSLAQLWRVHLLALLTPVHSFNLLCRLLPEQRAWRRFAHLPNRRRVPDVRMLHEFREQVGVAGLRRINDQLLQPLLPPRDNGAVVGVDHRCHRSGSCRAALQKKASGRHSAKRAALGIRTLKPGQSRFYLGYQKHTLRLWLSRPSYWQDSLSPSLS